MTPSVCIIEDDPIMGQSILDRFEIEGIHCDWKQTITTAKEALCLVNYRAIICDMRLPDGTGEEFLDELLSRTSPLPAIVFITAYGDLEHAVKLLKMGATDYITKPFDLSALILKIKKLCPELNYPTIKQSLITPQLGVSEISEQLQDSLIQVANYDVPILITGDSGVGKEHAALFLHQERKGNGQFLAINCAAIAESMLEAELFGHEVGAYTDAKKQRKGLFEQAHNGTLFLDEIGEMSPNMQSKLLRVLQDLTVRRIGGNENIDLQVKLIFATNRDLKQMVLHNEFREDLYYRINTINIHIPPLRDRREDIWWFAKMFVQQHNDNNMVQKTLLSATQDYLTAQPWQGNLRELKGIIQRACILSHEDTIGISDLCEQSILNNPIQETPHRLKDYLNQCEKEFIERALLENEHRINDTANQIGISRKNLWEKMQKLSITSPNS